MYVLVEGYYYEFIKIARTFPEITEMIEIVSFSFVRLR